jgi:hypothetical protein
MRVTQSPTQSRSIYADGARMALRVTTGGMLRCHKGNLTRWGTHEGTGQLTKQGGGIRVRGEG